MTNGRLSPSLRDLRDGLAQPWAWAAMATQDVRLRYRGSVLGPIWATLTTVVMVASMGVVYALIFKMDISVYLPFLTFGLIPWQFISSVVTEGCQSFIAAQPVMHQTRMPLTVHVMRVVYRNVLVMAHNIPVIIGVAAIFHIPWDWWSLMVLPGMCVLVISAGAICFMLGMISARFRDVPPIIGNVMQLVFFLTPVLWSINLLGQYHIIADANPVFAAIDIVRAPLLGQSPAVYSWPVALATCAVLCALAYGLFAKFRRRIAYWV